MNTLKANYIALFFLLFISTIAIANQAIVEKVKAQCNENRICRFTVSIRHADEGWTHFANGFEVLSPKGEVLGRRSLTHPHVNEQPFSRSIRNISIPPLIDKVIIKAYDSVHGASQQKYVVKLNFKRGEVW